MYSLKDYDYRLPAALIAQAPVPSRDRSRLMILDRGQQAISHAVFSDLEMHLSAGTLLVVNDTRVIPGRLLGRKETGGRIELLLLDYPGRPLAPEDLSGIQIASDEPLAGMERTVVLSCLVKASKRPRPGSRIVFGPDLTATVLDGGEGIYAVAFRFADSFDASLDRAGLVPLPPYIKRDGKTPAPCEDRETYQTVYAEKKGAVAAPTAGLHFSPSLLAGLRAKGVEVVPLTLHVGHGTFIPVRVTDIREHAIHSEWYELSPETAAAINRAKAEGRPVFAVGTTVVRVLEYRAVKTGEVKAGSGHCDLFIYPGFRFKVVDGMITNFHLPQSTLLMLVSAFAGREFVLKAYGQAIAEKYRFYSYGDAMLIL